MQLRVLIKIEVINPKGHTEVWSTETVAETPKNQREFLADFQELNLTGLQKVECTDATR